MGVRIQELPETTGIKKEDVLIVEDGQGTKKGTVQQLDETLGVSQLKEDLVNSNKAIAELDDKKITKFYANNLGETTLNDSDKGKIQDMILYGKSLQDGTPTPDNPIEIQSVVNPNIEVCGKNLLKPSLQTTTINGVTCTNNGDGTYTLNGTATDATYFKQLIALKKELII